MSAELSVLTSDPHHPPGLHVGNLLRHLDSNLDGIDSSEPLSATLMTGGRSNITYLLSQGSRSWVLRRPPLGNVLPSAHDMGREYKVLAGLAAAGFPVPQPFLLCSNTAIIGAPFMLMEYVPGRVIATSTDSQHLEPGEAAQISSVVVDTLARLHSVDPTSCGLSDLGRPHGFIERQVERWAAQWALTKTRELSALDILIHWLRGQIDSIPPYRPSSIIHGDYRLDNLILGSSQNEVVAVLDWEMATLGDPVADLAVTLVYWSEPGDTLRRAIPVADLVTSRPGFWTRAQIVSTYADSTGIDLDHLELCLALACLKLAVIMESIHLRTLQGQQLGDAAEQAGPMAAAATALAEMGVQVTRKRGLEALGM